MTMGRTCDIINYMQTMLTVYSRDEAFVPTVKQYADEGSQEAQTHFVQLIRAKEFIQNGASLALELDRNSSSWLVTPQFEIPPQRWLCETLVAIASYCAFSCSDNLTSVQFQPYDFTRNRAFYYWPSAIAPVYSKNTIGMRLLNNLYNQKLARNLPIVGGVVGVGFRKANLLKVYKPN
jgi:hypothetical protein